MATRQKIIKVDIGVNGRRYYSVIAEQRLGVPYIRPMAQGFRCREFHGSGYYYGFGLTMEAAYRSLQLNKRLIDSMLDTQGMSVNFSYKPKHWYQFWR